MAAAYRQWSEGQDKNLWLGQLVASELLSDDGIQLKCGDLLSPLHGSQELLLVLLGKVGQKLGTNSIQPLGNFNLLCSSGFNL